MTVTANKTSDLIKRYGEPPFAGNYRTPDLYKKALLKFESANMVVWDIPDDINREIKALPNKLYCNKDLIAPLEKVLRELIAAYKDKKLKKLDSIVTFDGCFNIRTSRGSDGISSHAFAISVDFNQFRNQLHATPTFSEAFVEIWERNGFFWGGRWKRLDGMHFELNTYLL